jgi:hypothetical protein
VKYSPPAVEHQEPIAAPFVIGTPYIASPTWTDHADADNQDPA